jgi:cytochrome c-type protein NapC
VTTVVTRVLGQSRLRDWIRQAFSPARTLSLAFLTLGGFLAGVFFWAASTPSWRPPTRNDSA